MNRIFIDVREPCEYAAGHVEGSINITPTEILDGALKLQDISRDTELILYCRTGDRSGVALNILSSMGFTNLVNGINQEHVKSKYQM